MLELSTMKVKRQVEEAQLRFNLFVLQQQFKETTAMLSEARRSINALRPVLLKYKAKVINIVNYIRHVLFKYKIIHYIYNVLYNINKLFYNKSLITLYHKFST